MTTIRIILKAIPYIACAGIPTFFFIRNNIKRNQKHRSEIDGKDKTINNLRNEIIEIIEIQGDIKDVNEQNKQIKKRIIDCPDIDSAYADKLSVMPRKQPRKRSNKKS